MQGLETIKATRTRNGIFTCQSKRTPIQIQSLATSKYSPRIGSRKHIPSTDVLIMFYDNSYLKWYSRSSTFNRMNLKSLKYGTWKLDGRFAVALIHIKHANFNSTNVSYSIASGRVSIGSSKPLEFRKPWQGKESEFVYQTIGCDIFIDTFLSTSVRFKTGKLTLSFLFNLQQ